MADVLGSVEGVPQVENLARSDGRITLSIGGDIDLAETTHLRSAMAAALELSDEVLLDLTATTLVDSAGTILRTRARQTRSARRC